MHHPQPHSRLFSIGEFSKIAGLTVKALRFYQEQGILPPALIDPQSGYRYYDQRQLETARVISYLRRMELPLPQIVELLRNLSDDQEILSALQRHKTALEHKLQEYRKTIRSLDRFITEERQAQTMAQLSYDVSEKVIVPMLIAGIRMKGRYSECGKAFAQMGRRLGRHICGKPFLLHYDQEFKEDDADFEPCMPLRQAKEAAGISVRQLDGGRCVYLPHKGPYDQLGHSYAKILQYVKDKGYHILTPTSELYLKGPGMIFKGNPANYLTEIQILVEPSPARQLAAPRSLLKFSSNFN